MRAAIEGYREASKAFTFFEELNRIELVQMLDCLFAVDLVHLLTYGKWAQTDEEKQSVHQEAVAVFQGKSYFHALSK
jgi:hypothetical protein